MYWEGDSMKGKLVKWEMVGRDCHFLTRSILSSILPIQYGRNPQFDLICGLLRQQNIYCGGLTLLKLDVNDDDDFYYFYDLEVCI